MRTRCSRRSSTRPSTRTTCWWRAASTRFARSFQRSSEMKGSEGVLAVGPGVTNVAVGDRVVPPRSSWVWRERMVIPAGGLFALPRGAADPKQLAMLAMAPPTASLLLSDYVDLNRQVTPP